MEELIKTVSAKTGISEDQARTAVTTVLGFLKEKLPAPLASQIDSAVQPLMRPSQASRSVISGLSMGMCIFSCVTSSCR